MRDKRFTEYLRRIAKRYKCAVEDLKIVPLDDWDGAALQVVDRREDHALYLILESKGIIRIDNAEEYMIRYRMAPFLSIVAPGLAK